MVDVCEMEKTMSGGQLLLLKVLYVTALLAAALVLFIAVQHGVDAQAAAVNDYAEVWGR